MTQPHILVKPERIAQTAVALLWDELVLPKLFTSFNFMDFAGTKDDTVSMVVEGLLPSRKYGWRNDRSTERQFDRYVENKVAVTLGNDIYSGVKVIDEQYLMDLDGWAKLVGKQAQAVAFGLQAHAVDYLVDTVESAPFALGNAEANLWGAIVQARKIMNASRLPQEGRYLLLSPDFEAALLMDDRFSKALNAGDNRADNALTSATLGRLGGFTLIVANELEAGTAIAFHKSAVALGIATPKPPLGAAFKSSASYGGFGLRWVCDYDIVHAEDRSVVDAFYGFQKVEDILPYTSATGTQIDSMTPKTFLRGIQLGLGTEVTTKAPAAGSPLALATGLSA